MRRAAALLAALAGPAPAEPPPEYFAGVFERVGRSGDDPPVLFRDHVRLVPEGRDRLRMLPCDAATAAAGLKPDGLPLVRDRSGEVANLLSTPEGMPWFGCQHFNDMDNYPILACHGDDGSLVTLWPANHFGACPTRP